MPKFPNSLQAWQSESFARTLKDEIEGMDAGTLPLHQGTSRGGLIDDANITAMPLTSTEEEGSIVADVGVFFTEIVAACSCGEDPDPINAYCRLRIRIDKDSAEADILALPD